VTTSYRDVFLLACCQALLLVNASGLISMNGLVGYDLAGTKTLATLGATTYVVGSAVAAMPMSLWMERVGRRRGFMAGALINVLGCALGVIALWQRSFALFCVATAVIGVYNAIGLQYRFAAAEVAAPSDRARAVSLVLAGGVAGGLLGPQSVRLTRDLTGTPFFGSFAILAAYALIALAVQARLKVPRPAREARTGGRSLGAITRQPVFVAAVTAAAMRKPTTSGRTSRCRGWDVRGWDNRVLRAAASAQSTGLPEPPSRRPAGCCVSRRLGTCPAAPRWAHRRGRSGPR